MSPEYLIGELAEKSGVSIRTIRYYISEGLLPSPDVRGRYSVYDENYLRRIELIKRLKDAYLPIKEIKAKLESQSEEEIEAFLKIYEGRNSLGKGALDYIHQVQEQEKTQRRLQPMPPVAKQSSRAVFEADKQVYDPNDLENENWVRIKIVDGIELSVQQQIYYKKKQKILVMVKEFKDKVGDKPEENR